jgi:hypothetical protein
MSHVVIDLGEARDEPVPARRRDTRWPWSARAAAVAAVLLSVAALGASTAPVPAPVEVWREPSVTRYDVVGGVIVAHHPRGNELVGYDLADGRRRWSLPDEADGGFYPLDGYVTISKQTLNSAETRSAFLDPATGRTVLWTTYIPLGAPAPDRLTMFSQQLDDSVRFRVASADTGATREVLRLPANTVWQGSRDSSQVLWLTVADGTLHLSDLFTGAVVSRPGALPPRRTYDVVGFTATPTLWIIYRYARGELWLDAFAADDLSPRWAVTLPAPEGEEDPTYVRVAVGSCGPVICAAVGGRNGEVLSTRLLDPADGRQVRVVDRAVWPVGPSRWQAAEPAPGVAPPTASLVDVLTGAVPFPAWNFEHAVDERRYLLTARRPAGTAIGVFDTATGRLTPAGTIPTGYGECHLAPPYLMCLALSDRTLVTWRLRAPLP